MNEPVGVVGVPLSQLKQKLVEHFAATGVKVSPKELERAYKDVCASRELKETIKAVEQHAKVMYVAADITRADDVQRLITETKSLGTITGIIHGAGVLADALIEKKKIEDIHAVLTTKLTGLQMLLQHIPLAQLDTIMLFSSVAATYGNRGQADYACANEILNVWAHSLHQRMPDKRVVALDWGPWEGGMVTPELKKMFTERGIAMIPLDAGAAILHEELVRNDGREQVIIGPEI
jgi:NADP-dependent 3-hydroxy acid dehydrogenase YdfG